MENQSDIKIASTSTKSFLKDKHVQFLLEYSKSDNYENQITDYLKMSGIYWVVSSLSLLDVIDDSLTDGIVEFYRKCIDKESGGISASVGHDAHILYTLSAVQILILLKRREEIDVDRIVSFIQSLQNENGSFCGDKWGETDSRFSFCAIACLSLLNRLDAINVEKAVEFVKLCQNMDGGFGCRRYSESHAGLTYCCVGMLAITKSLDSIDLDLLGWWLSERQCASGGFNGRPEKLPDVCYSWWVLASLKIIGRESWIDSNNLTNFILMCQDTETGGFSDRPDNVPDPFHTLFGIGALSLLEYKDIQPINPIYCMTRIDCFTNWNLLLEKDGSIFYLELNNSNINDANKDIKEIEESLNRTSITRRSLRKRKNNQKVTNLICDKVYADFYEVVYPINNENLSKFGRRTKLVETLFGLSIIKHSDHEKVIVSDFIDSNLRNSINCGDWLHSINGLAVCFSNVESTLRSMLQNSKEITLGLLKPQKEDIIDNKSINFDQYLVKDEDIEKILLQHGTGLVYVNIEENNVLFNYPKNKEKYFLTYTRGMFLTINDLLRNEFGHIKPTCTVINLESMQLPLAIFYKKDKGNILLMSMSLINNTLEECKKIFEEFLKIILFRYQSLNCAFIEKLDFQVYHLLSLFFARLFTKGKFHLNKDYQMKIPSGDLSSVRLFENILSHVTMVPLLREPLMQLNDTLNELEAADYRDLDDNTFIGQRQFSIIGSCVYHNGYLLCSHLNEEDFIEVNAYCKNLELFNMSRNCSFKNLVIWCEVYLKSYHRNKKTCVDNFDSCSIPNNRSFLLICGIEHDLLIVLMEKGIHTEENLNETVIKPDPFYIDEVQETLKHIQNMNVTFFADRWIENNFKPQINLTESLSNKLNCTNNNWNFLNFASKKSSSESKTDLVEESTSNDALSLIKSEASDDLRIAYNSDDSNSDCEVEKIAHLDNSLMNSNRLMPLKLTAGDCNYLLHFVQLNNLDGILLSSLNTPDSNSEIFESILNNFRTYSLIMHEEFQRTIDFKKSENMTESDDKSLNKYYLEEQGVSFKLRNLDEHNRKLLNSFTYWIIGKLTSDLNEIFVCYQDSVPQNIVEMAFKLNLNCLC